MRPEGDITEQRKRDHLKPFRCGGAEAKNVTTWLECVHLIHTALPEMSVEEIDLSVEFAGRRFGAPLFITGMTGGTPEAGEINRGLARVAERLRIGFGLGSGRAMLDNPDLASTYRVRPQAPNAFLAWNLGGVQLIHTPVERIRRALDQLELDAVCIHLNPAQELMQPEGDRDFRGVLEAIERLVRSLERPVIVKETGAGIGRGTGLRLRDAGVRWIDVAGCGGTSWVGVEVMRRGGEGDAEGLAFWDWGIPTAAAICDLADCGLGLIASGGIRTGLDAARAIALGADVVGLAAPVLQAYFHEGEAGCERLLRGVLRGLRNSLLLTGCRNATELKRAPRVVTAALRQWIESKRDDGWGHAR